MKIISLSGTALGLSLGVALVLNASTADARPDHKPRERPSFAELDLNADGVLTLQELQQHRLSKFEQRDLDGNGSLNAQELQQAAEARAERMIAKLDQNADGELSFEELAAAKGKGKRKGQPSPERLFERMDADQDGVVTDAEFAKMAKKKPLSND